MRRTRLLATTAIAASLVAGHGCGGASPAPASASPPGPSATELEALYRARTDSARTHFTEADVRFMTGMIYHHAQALEMSALAPTHGASDAMRTLTARTINAQRDEIVTMQNWLRERDQPVPEVGPEGHVAGAGSIQMPGMLTAEQMSDLDAARGPEFDRLFLTYMIQHHQGAVAMVHDLFSTNGAALGDAVFKIASDIQADQTSEIARMERMLEGFSGPGPRP